MEHKDFRTKLLFLTATGLWRCTDVGKRTIAAIKIEKDKGVKHPDYDGPPYSVVERVFDENDFGGCWLPKRGPLGFREKPNPNRP
jgi:hypothetical protein